MDEKRRDGKDLIWQISSEFQCWELLPILSFCVDMFFPFVSLQPVFFSSTACPSLALFYVTEGWLIQVEFLRLPTGFDQWQVLWEYCGRWGLLGAKETFSVLYKTSLLHSMEIYNFLENEDWLIYIFRDGCIIIGTQCKTKLWRFLFK